MKYYKIVPFLFSFILFIACNESEDEIPDGQEGKATFTVSGAESGTLEFNQEIEFAYSVSSVSGGEISVLEIYIGNYPTTPSSLKISIVEQGNSSGFEERKYTYEEMSSTEFVGFISLYVSENAAYSINPEAGAVNQITYTKISNTKIEGSFEVNLEESISGSGEKIKITGTFEAMGEAAFL
ncbi:MAG: hypothetical protein RLQ12_11430 [Cyclobacteriaceae bacterium]